ncbi:MAG: squalene/phytoene synthase family protein [Pseudomonadota bacterium]
MTPLDHCAALVAEADPDRFLSAMTAPVAGRARLLPLYAVFVEIARAPWASDEPMIGLMRLQFWEDGLAEICAGRPPRAHPVLEALAPLADACAMRDFAALIAARRCDRDAAHPPDPAALCDYLIQSAAVPMRMAARVLAGRALSAPPERNTAGKAAAGNIEAGDRASGNSTLGDAALGDAAGGIGFAFGAARLLRALPALSARGSMPLPGVSSAARLALAEGQTLPELGAAVACLGKVARDRHRAGLLAARRAPQTTYPALRAAWRTGRILGKARPGVDLLRDLGEESEFARRVSLIWRQALGRV